MELAAVQQARAADAASRRQDRDHFTCYHVLSAFPFSVGGAADAQALGPDAFVSRSLSLSQPVASLRLFRHQRVPLRKVHLPAHKAIQAAEDSHPFARIARGRTKITRLNPYPSLGAGLDSALPEINCQLLYL